MKTVFVTMSRGGLIRNFFDTGVISYLLESGERVVVLSPQYDREDIFEPYTHENLIIEPLIPSDVFRLRKVMYELSRLVIFNPTVDVRYRYRLGGSVNPSKFFYIPRRILALILKLIPRNKELFRYLGSTVNPQKEHDYLFEKYKPDIVFSTAPQTLEDVAVLKSAKRFGSYTVAMPKSWDNLSKVLIPLKTERLIVWSPFMKDQAVEFQGYKESEIVMVGVPQFDYYTKESNKLSREEFCKPLGLDPDKPFILYGSSGGDAYPEGDFVELILGHIESGVLPDVQVLIRPHIGWLNDEKRYTQFVDHPSVVLDLSEERDSDFKDHWTTSKTHLEHLFNSILHSAVSVNILSTLTLDAAACGVPTINLKFDPKKQKKEDSIYRLHVSDYIDELQKMEGTWLAESAEDLKEALIATVVRGEKTRPKTPEMVEHFIYKVDGNSAKRTAEAILTAG